MKMMVYMLALLVFFFLEVSSQACKPNLFWEFWNCISNKDLSITFTICPSLCRLLYFQKLMLLPVSANPTHGRWEIHLLSRHSQPRNHLRLNNDLVYNCYLASSCFMFY
jgi:hypothetical protein